MDMLDMYKRLFYASKQAGIVASMMQAGIPNEGKFIIEEKDESGAHKAMREAKTKVDEIVQEMLLQSLLPAYQNMLSLDVEEDTPSLSLFPAKDYAYTLVLDPIDGTLDYINQKDTYSICSAILHEHDVLLAIVYFPKRDLLYAYVEGRGTYLYHHVAQCEWEDGEPLTYQPLEETPTLIYKNSRVGEDILLRLQQNNFQVYEDSDEYNCPDAILQCLQGKALAYFSANRNIRDILLGAILSKMDNGQSFGFHGEEMMWESHGRQKEIVFTIYPKALIFKKV